jgi:amidohydrolase
LRDALHRAFAATESLGGRYEIALHEGYPPVVNDERMTTLARDAITAVLGSEAVVPFEPWMGAEDFALLAREAPGCFVWLGAALDPPREHHHPAFDIDERALAPGAAALASCALTALQRLRG